MVMSPENRALCYFYRNPPPESGCKRMKWTAIAKLVWNTDGSTHPTPCSVRKCVLGWQRERKKRGRQTGARKTSREDDQCMVRSFEEARRPLGTAVTSRDVADLLPQRLRSKVSLRLIRRRLAERGYVPEKKLEKTDFLDKQRKLRVAFCKAHERRTPAGWSTYLQGWGSEGLHIFPETNEGEVCPVQMLVDIHEGQ